MNRLVQQKLFPQDRRSRGYLEFRISMPVDCSPQKARHVDSSAFECFLGSDGAYRPWESASYVINAIDVCGKSFITIISFISFRSFFRTRCNPRTYKWTASAINQSHETMTSTHGNGAFLSRSGAPPIMIKI